VERLAATEGGGEGLDGDADDIVFGLLCGQGGAGGLRVEAEEERARIFCAETVAHDFGPEAWGGAVLGDFFEQVAMCVEEERELGSEVIHAEAGIEGCLDVGDTVGESEGDFLDGSRAGFANVVAGDGDGVPLGEIVAAPGEDVGDDTHGGADWIDVRAASDVFLEDVVLDGAGKFGEAGALFFWPRRRRGKEESRRWR